MGSLRECGDGCACGPSCGNRRTQLGVTVRLRVVRHREKGWGLHAAEVLRRGQFVCEYAGNATLSPLLRINYKMICKVYHTINAPCQICLVIAPVNRNEESDVIC